MNQHEKSAARAFGGTCPWTNILVNVIEDDEKSGLKKGQKIIVNHYGTFGAWTKDGKYIPSYKLKMTN